MWFFEMESGVCFTQECEDWWATHLLDLYPFIVSAVKVDS